MIRHKEQGQYNLLKPQVTSLQFFQVLLGGIQMPEQLYSDPKEADQPGQSGKRGSASLVSNQGCSISPDSFIAAGYF